MGKYDSSLTRVRPVFQELLARDTSGRPWLRTLLGLGSESKEYAALLANSFSELLTKEAKDCLEVRVSPPERFLRWLIDNPQRMRWPDGKEYGEETQSWREKLLGRHGEEAVLLAQNEARKQLDACGSEGSSRKWWAFEGFTSVDCYLKTDTFILFIEGKRTEAAQSRSTDWYPERDQIIRNLEAVKDLAAGKDFAVLVITEKAPCLITADTFARSLPHLSHEERDEIASHYLGCTTWKAVCDGLNIDYSKLPDTVDNA